jgi:hypothetical protein
LLHPFKEASGFVLADIWVSEAFYQCPDAGQGRAQLVGYSSSKLGAQRPEVKRCRDVFEKDDALCTCGGMVRKKAAAKGTATAGKQAHS